jgi:hypothetical protein
MNEKIEELMYHAGLTAQGCWDEMDDYGRKAIENLAGLIIQECITAVQNTPKHCAYTTFQESIVDCTVDMSVQSIKQHFNLNNDSK